MTDYKELIETDWQEQKARTAAACAVFQASGEWWSAWMILYCRTLELPYHLFLACRPDRTADRESGGLFVTRRY